MSNVITDSNLVDLTEEDLATVTGGDANACTVAGGLTAAAVGFALAAIGVATAGWGALAGAGMYAACSASDSSDLGNISDVIGA